MRKSTFRIERAAVAGIAVLLALMIIGVLRGNLWWIPAGAALMSALAFEQAHRLDAEEGWQATTLMIAGGFLINCMAAGAGYVIGFGIRMLMW